MQHLFEKLGLIALSLAMAASGTGVFASNATAPVVNPDQAGLTGAWYDPATNGQGLTLQVLPDQNGVGQGIVFGGWYTFDNSASGDASKQRWYTFQGSTVANTSGASLTIYQSLGGNFNAAPAIKGNKVGTATLTFSDCTHATLNYNFISGTYPGGSLPLNSGSLSLTRLSTNITCTASGSNGPPPAASGLSGAWFDPATSGQGLMFDLDPVQGILFAGWFTYASDGAQAHGASGQRWYTLQAPIGNSLAEIDGIPIYATIGGVFNAAVPTTTTQVGTANLTISDCTHAHLSYTFTDGSNQAGSVSLGHAASANCNTTTLAMPGALTAPASIHPTDLTVVADADEYAVATDSTFSIARSAGLPAIAWAVHSSGYAVLLGLIDPSAQSAQLDSHSSALALLYMGLGGSFIADAAKRNVIATLDTDPATSTLAAVIDARLAQDVHAIDNADGQIMAALKAALTDIGNRAAVAGAISHAKSLRQTSSASEAASSTGSPGLLLIQPNSQSGLSLLQGNGDGTVVVQNTKRREAEAFVYENGYVDSAGNRTNLSPVGIVDVATEINPTAALSVFNILSILSGSAPPLAPVNSAPIPLPGEPNAVRTDYDVVVLTPTFCSGCNDFSVLADARFDNVRAGLQATLDQQHIRAGLQITLGTLMEAFGVRSYTSATQSFDSWAATLEGIPDNTLAQFLLDMKSAESLSTGVALLTSGVQGGIQALDSDASVIATIQTRLGPQALQQILQMADPEFAQVVAANGVNTAMQTAKLTALRVSAAVSIILAVGDVTAQLVDFTSGNSVNLFGVDQLNPKVKLNPENGSVNLGDDLQLSATVPGYQNNPSVSYTWTLSPTDSAHLEDTDGHSTSTTNASFNTQSNSVNFFPGVSPDSSYHVEVEAFYQAPGGRKLSFGTASATVSVNGLLVDLAPEAATILYGSSANFSVQFTPEPNDTAGFQYEWSNSHGSGCGSVASTGASAVYDSNPNGETTCSQGDDFVEVTVFTMQNGSRVNIGTAQAALVFTNPWVGTFAGLITIGCGNSNLGGLTYNISSGGGNALFISYEFGEGPGGYTATFTGNSAVSDNGVVTMTLSNDGNSLFVDESNSCQSGTLTRQQ